ncbi:MAG: type III-A CRISPR-associated RAMP protein Csm3 [Anaerovoracaceae bacterium]
MFSKLELTGKIVIKTGMHIGGSESFAAIGALDSPVIKDKLTDLPIIPGSSLKGKMRTLLAKVHATGKINNRHNEDPEILLRLFGSANDKAKEKSWTGRLICSDSFMRNDKELEALGVIGGVEAKEENTIDRITAKANPRQIERVVRGAEFSMSLIYTAEEETEIVEDIGLIAEGLKLLTYDYLGGHGSRGYGRVAFRDLEIHVVAGKDLDESMEEACNAMLEEV